jgi:hypothetical protein
VLLMKQRRYFTQSEMKEVWDLHNKLGAEA